MEFFDGSVITLHGDYDVYTKRLLENALAPAFQSSSVVIDFSRVGYVDSTVITILVRMRKERAARSYPPAHLVGITRNVERILEICGLDNAWPRFRTVADALAAFDPE